MPGNTVKINDYDKLEWYVGDSKMPNLIKTLDEIGHKISSIRKRISAMKEKPGTGAIDNLNFELVNKFLKRNNKQPLPHQVLSEAAEKGLIDITRTEIGKILVNKSQLKVLLRIADLRALGMDLEQIQEVFSRDTDA